MRVFWAFFEHKKQHSETTYPTKRQQVFSPIFWTTKPLCRWLASLRDTNHHHQCFFSCRRQSQNRNPRRRRGTPRFSVWRVRERRTLTDFNLAVWDVGGVSGRSHDQMVIGWPCVRGYTITHPVLKSGLFFAHNCGKFTPLRLQRRYIKTTKII